MPTYTIGEVAARTGFTASALRYYEGIGLLAPPDRTEAGYRRYDEDALERLRFIARAKQLGCSLDEVAELVPLWDGERCETVQHRLLELVTDRVAAARRQAGELAALADQLDHVAGHLTDVATDGPCRPRCACLDDEADERPEESAVTDAAPLVCTLPGDELPDRLGDWRQLLASARQRRRLGAGRWRVVFGDVVDLVELARLVAAEQRCCRFLSFTISVGTDEVRVDVAGPAGAEDLVAALVAA